MAPGDQEREPQIKFGGKAALEGSYTVDLSSRNTLDAAWEAAHRQLISEMVVGEIPDDGEAILSKAVRLTP